MKKGLLVGVIALQLLIALTQDGWPRSVAELSAFLLVLVVAWEVQRSPVTRPSGSAAKPETKSI